MNRQTIVERALCVLVPLLGFAVFYGLPMLGLKFAVDHGLYVASAATVLPFLRATPLERISEVLGYHEHDGRRCAHVILEELDGAPEFECCTWVDELHIDTLPGPGNRPSTSQVAGVGNLADVVTGTSGMSQTHPSSDLSLRSEEKPLNCEFVGVDTLDGGMNDTPEEVLASLDPDGGHVTVSETAIGEALTIAYERYYSSPGTAPEHVIVFDPICTKSLTAGSISPEQIPAVIDALTEMHRAWLQSGGAA
jgi:hypothetical protein